MTDQSPTSAQPATKINILKFLTLFLSGVIFVVMATAIAILMYQYYENSQLITRYARNATTYESNAAIMATQQADITAQLEQSRADLSTAQEDAQNKADKINDLQTRFSKLTAEKNDLLDNYTALFCDRRISEVELKKITNNEDLLPIIQHQLELAYDEKIVDSDINRWGIQGKTAIIDFKYDNTYHSTVYVTWIEKTDEIYSIYLLDGSCFFYLPYSVDDTLLPNG